MPFAQNRLGKFAGSTQEKGTEVPVPVALWRLGFRSLPKLVAQLDLRVKLAALRRAQANAAKRLAEDQRSVSSASASFPKIARIRSFPAAFFCAGSDSLMNLWYALRSSLFASRSARMPRSASAIKARLTVKSRSFAIRRTSTAKSPGMVTLCRTARCFARCDRGVLRCVATSLLYPRGAPLWFSRGEWKPVVEPTLSRVALFHRRLSGHRALFIQRT
jgi:hypothetical protein